MVVVQQNRVTPSPFNFGLWTLDLDCDNEDGNIYMDLSVRVSGVIPNIVILTFHNIAAASKNKK